MFSLAFARDFVHTIYTIPGYPMDFLINVAIINYTKEFSESLYYISIVDSSTSRSENYSR